MTKSPQSLRFLAFSCTALLLAAMAPAFMLWAISKNLNIGLLAFWIALAHAIILDLPTFVSLSSRRRFDFKRALAAGFIIGVLPAAIFAWPLSFMGGFTSSIDEVPMIVDGIPTWAGWKEYFVSLAYLGLLGSLGSTVFWCALRIAGYPNGQEIVASQDA